MSDREDDRADERDPFAGLPPELRDAYVMDEATEAAEAAEERRAAVKRRNRGLIIGLIALVVAVAMIGYGLLPLFQSPAPEEREPGPLPAVPAGTAEAFGDQQPEWRDCGDGQLCADVHAPIDWEDPAGERLSLHMVKLPATGGDPLGTLFVNPGGPGASGASYVVNTAGSVTEEVRERYDVIGWDPRGVGNSTPVQCLDAAGMDEYLFGDAAGLAELERGSAEWIAAAEEESAMFGEACAEHTGPALEHVDTHSTVQDLDMLRSIVGDEHLNYLGYSYGTFIGAHYADTYPESVGRLVLDGAIDPQTTEFEVVREQTRGFEAALRTYVEDCLSRNECPLTGTVDRAMQQIGGLLDRVDEHPLTASDGRELGSGTLLTAIITPLYSQSSWPALDSLFETVANGNADTALQLADFYYSREDGQYSDNSTEAFIAINCLDYPNSIDVDRMRAEAQELAEVAPTIGRFQGYGDVGCAGWPYPAAEVRGPVEGAGAAPILVVGTTGDPATPYRWAESLSEQLESATLVTFQGEGHTAYGKNDCINNAVDAYLLEGEVPASDPMCS
ncbi:MAG: alpha/beta hydrolase [Leucobacter sp.]